MSGITLSQSTGDLDADAGSSAAVEERRVDEQRRSGTHEGNRATFGDSSERTVSGPDLANNVVIQVAVAVLLLILPGVWIWNRFQKKKYSSS